MVTRARGFTVLEVMVASAIALAIVAGAGAMLGQMVLQHRRDTEHARLRAGLDLALLRISQDLRHAGLGLPTAVAPEGEAALAPLLHAGESQLVLAGDLPHPDQVLNGCSLAVRDQRLGGMRLGNELNEDRPTAAATPKHGTGEFAILVNSRGEWVPLASADPTFLIGPNRGFVSTPDRVFYRLEAGALVRKQCFGPVLPQGATTPCRGSDGTGWEPLVSGVRQLRFEYSTGTAAVLSPLPLSPEARAKVRRVRVYLALRSTAGEATLDLADETLVALRQ